MNEPIKAGDLVIVARPWSCCANNIEGLGSVRTVAAVVESPPRDSGCFYCGYRPEVYADLGDGYCPVDRLKRIPPMAEIEGEKREEEVHA